MNKVNYPVKYAVYPVKELTCSERGNEYEKLVCFIVSKAYVMEEVKYMNNEGKYQKNYKVCFPHIISDQRINYYHVTPNSDVGKDNVIVTSKLFDSYDEALEIKDNKNLLYDSNIVDKYNIMEKEILELEKDMEVNKDNIDTKIKRL